MTLRNELDVIKLAVDIPEEGLKKGMVGAIVMIFTQPYEAYMVEFCDNEGRTIAMPTLKPDQLQD